MSVAFELQSAIYSALSADSALSSIIGNPPRIYDIVPIDALFPLMEIGATRMVPLEGLEGAYEHTVRINMYSKWGGRKECKDMAAEVKAVLQNARLPLEGHEMVQARLIFEDHLRFREPDTFQGTQRFRFVTLPTGEGAP